MVAAVAVVAAVAAVTAVTVSLSPRSAPVSPTVSPWPPCPRLSPTSGCWTGTRAPPPQGWEPIAPCLRYGPCCSPASAQHSPFRALSASILVPSGVDSRAQTLTAILWGLISHCSLEQLSFTSSIIPKLGVPLLPFASRQKPLQNSLCAWDLCALNITWGFLLVLKALL